MSIIAYLGNKDNSKYFNRGMCTYYTNNSNSSCRYKESPLSLDLLPSFLLQIIIVVVVVTLILTTILIIIIVVVMSL